MAKICIIEFLGQTIRFVALDHRRHTLNRDGEFLLLHSKIVNDAYHLNANVNVWQMHCR